MKGSWFQLLRFSSVGLEMGIAVFIGWLLGSWLDKKLGTSPWLMLLCLLFGVGAAFKALIDAARKASRTPTEPSEHGP